jgi:hypothetical protein
LRDRGRAARIGCAELLVDHAVQEPHVALGR